MDYQKIYNQLIQSAINNPKPDQYKETHHIIPVCMSGSNKKENLVRLTARQHFVAHWLLFKIHRNTKLAHAWFSMCRVGIGQDKRKVNSKHFARVKEVRSKLMSENSKGENNHFYGKKHSDETKRKLIEIRTGTKASDEARAKMSAKRKGVKKNTRA